MEQDPPESDRPTVTIHRDALLGLIGRSAAPEPARAHTVSRDELRARAVTRDDTATTQMPPLAEPVEAADVDLSPTLSPLLVGAVVALLLCVFFAIVRLH